MWNVRADPAEILEAISGPRRQGPSCPRIRRASGSLNGRLGPAVRASTEQSLPMLVLGAVTRAAREQSSDQSLHARNRLEVLRQHFLIGNADACLLLYEADDLHQPHRIDQVTID